MRPRRTGSASAVLGALVLAGCGSSAAIKTTTTTASTPAQFNTCSAVTQAEAASALGESVSPGQLGHATVEGGRACVFYGPSAPRPHDPNLPQADTVRVVIVKGPRAARYYEDYRSRVRAEAIAGYGGQAFFDGFASLNILKGDAYLRVAVVPAGAPPSLADEKKLAAGVLPRL